MHVRTDDDVYRVDAVWLGPPRATFPWRARYVSYGVGLLVMLFLMFVQRRLGIELGFFSMAWALVGTVAITRFLGKKIGYERPFGQVVTQFWAEVTGPRARTAVGGGALRAGHVRTRSAGGRAVIRNVERSGGGPLPATNRAAPIARSAASAETSWSSPGRAAPVRTTGSGRTPASDDRKRDRKAGRGAWAGSRGRP